MYLFNVQYKTLITKHNKLITDSIKECYIYATALNSIVNLITSRFKTLVFLFLRINSFASNAGK